MDKHQLDGVETSAAGVPENRLAMLQAKAQQADIHIYELSDGSYLACRWNLTKEIPDLHMLSQWLYSQGVR